MMNLSAREYTEGRVFSVADGYILDRLQKNLPDTVVEIGCGPGIIAERALFAEEYICADINLEFLKVASVVRPSGAFLNCRAEVLPLRESFADCVVAMAVLHHLESADLRLSLSEIYRILKPGGVFLLLEDWCFSSGITEFEEEARRWRFRNGSDENHLSADNWRGKIMAAGFSCKSPAWVERPFNASTPHLMKWPKENRIVRMMALESVKSP